MVDRAVIFQPVNGREMTADDVAFSIERGFLSDLPFSMKSHTRPGENIQSVEAADRYTVVVKGPPEHTYRRLTPLIVHMHVWPPEAGGPPPGDYRDWRDCIGTGPFMIVDEVPSSSMTFARNPNYWMNDPVHPENTLPYLDGINILVIPDASTRLAALRTGKIDFLQGVSWEDKDSLVKTSPELKWVGGLSEAEVIGMRIDKPELPFDDIRVRRALAMGLDRQAIAEDFYCGNAEVFAFLVVPIPALKDMFTPLDELAESIQELYEYNPEKARQLLAEAGYPNGFQTEIVCTQNHVDLLSIIKAYWADIGVDLKLDVKEDSLYFSIFAAHKHTQMFFGEYARVHIEEFGLFTITTPPDTSMVDDPYLNDIYTFKLVKDVWDWDTLCQVIKEEVNPYALEQCWYIDPPLPMRYTFWQLWLKGYHGEQVLGAHGNAGAWLAYVWLDQELKKEMTGH